MSILAGNGQSGLVSAEVMRVSASMPSVTVTAEASTRGCTAIARVGLSSSQSGGKVEPAPVPCSGIERQALAHCARAFCSKLRSLRTRASTAVTCSATVLSINGLTCAGTLTRAPATTRLVSPSVTCAARFGSRCQAAASFGREVKVTLPLISALALSDLMFTLPICLATLPPSTPAERVADRAGRLRRQRARDVELSGQRRCQRQHVLAAGRHDRAARGGPADVGVLQDLRHRIVGLAGEIARRCAIGGVAYRGERDRDRRQDEGAFRDRRQRRQFDQHRRRRPAARGDPVHRLQADEKRDRDHRDPEQNGLEAHRQPHRPPGLIQGEVYRAGLYGARVADRGYLKQSGNLRVSSDPADLDHGVVPAKAGPITTGLLFEEVSASCAIERPRRMGPCFRRTTLELVSRQKQKWRGDRAIFPA